VVSGVSDEALASARGHSLRSEWSEWHEVAPTPAALAPTRRWLSQSLGKSLTHNAMDEVQLLVSELITNALRHAPGRVGVRYSLGPVSIVVEVRDERIDLPYPTPSLPPPNATSGRGLALVRQLSTQAGLNLGEEWKTAWFEYGLPAASNTQA